MSPTINIDRHIGTRAKNRRVEMGLSLEQMAEKVGVTEAQMFRYESGGTPIKPKLMLKLAGIFRVDMSYFLEGL